MSAFISNMVFENTESTAGNNTWKQNVKVLHATEEIVINDTLMNAGFTKITEGVNLVNPVCMTMLSAATQFSKHLNL